MLHAFDNTGSPSSDAYVGYQFDGLERREVRLSFRLESRRGIYGPVCVALVESANGPLAAVYYGSEGEVFLRGFSYTLYPNLYSFPDTSLYPYASRGAYPLEDTYPSYGLYPGMEGPRDVFALDGSGGAVWVSLSLSGINTDRGQAEIYAEKRLPSGRMHGNSATISGLRWRGRNPLYAFLGAVHAVNTPYDFLIGDMELLAEQSDGQWYAIDGYHGFRTDNPEVLWVGTREISDPDQYTEPSDIRFLARYPYARPESGGTPSLRGVRWRLSEVG